MKTLLFSLAFLPILGVLSSCTNPLLDSDDPGTGIVTGDSTLIVDHASTNLASIPAQSLAQAKTKLIIAYGHTSHGSQLISGMEGLSAWKGSAYAFNATGSGGALQLRDMPFSGASDLGSPDRTAWASATRTYLKAHTDVNVIMWSWCGQVSSATHADIESYLGLMNGLEAEFPAVRFVYMTGHLDGSGLTGNLHIRNEQIRTYCRANKKTLFDFADIESYDPDGLPFLAKNANDNCDYDSDGNGSLDRNWATEWQTAHPGQWYNCSAAHSQPLNGNLKAFAAWRLFATIAN